MIGRGVKSFRGPSALWLAIAVASSSTGCGSAWVVGRGISDWEDKNYVEAVDHFEEVERDASDGTLDDKATARYYAYRGLCHYELWKKSKDTAERRRAVRHLGKAARLVKKGDPEWFPKNVHDDLDAAFAELGIDKDASYEKEPGRGWK